MKEERLVEPISYMLERLESVKREPLSTFILAVNPIFIEYQKGEETDE